MYNINGQDNLFLYIYLYLYFARPVNIDYIIPE